MALVRSPQSPTESEAHTVRLDDDRQLTYATYGHPDGAPVLFLHGTPGSRRLGELLAPAARGSGVRVLAPDRPGYGESTPWRDRSVSDAPEFVTPVLEDADAETAGLVAFSGGAPAAFATALTRPERVTRVDVVAGATPPDCGPAPLGQRLLRGLATTTPSVLRGLFRAQAWLARRRDPSFVVTQYTANADRVPDDVASLVRRDFVEACAGSGRGAVTEFRNVTRDWELVLEDIEVPVHLWHGTRDTNVPLAGAREFASRLPTGTVHRIDDADHLGALRRSVPEVLPEHGEGRPPTSDAGGQHPSRDHPV